MIRLVLGGARSGKSRYAQQLAQDYENQGMRVLYIATAQSDDAEMASRIAHHQRSRPSHWRTVEEPIQLAQVLAKYDDAQTVILVDCLTLWLTNLLCSEDDQVFDAQKEQLLTLLPKLSSPLILVSNETGLGVVPMGQLTRRFVDEAGWLHQALAQIADEVTFCVAGLPMILKPSAR